MGNEIQQQNIQNIIYAIRGVQVMLDRDLAKLYQVEVAQMNRQVKRNNERFLKDFMFQLTKEEWNNLKCQNGISNARGCDLYFPYVFTEQVVSALSGILKSEHAIQMNIRIIRAFVAMRRFLSTNACLFQIIELMERK